MVNVRMSTPVTDRFAPKIKVIGVGGAGGNAVNNMMSSGLEGAEFVVCNSDAQALQASLAPTKIQLGQHVTGGLGAGAKPEVGRAAAEESLEEVLKALDGANMVFVTAGMGGGTGTGAAPVIARAAREQGILTVGVVTKPFHFEGTHRMKLAEQGVLEMQDYVDTLIVIPNQNLFRIANEKTTFDDAFKMADSVLQSGVRGVTDLMVMPGLINLDFADIRSAMQEMGKAMMGTGEASGERRATEAAEAAISNPLLDDVSMQGARGVIINITGGYDMTLFEVDEACNRIRDEVDPDANIIFGSTFDQTLEGVMRVSVVATGIDAHEYEQIGQDEGAVPEVAIASDVVESAPVTGISTPAHIAQMAQKLRNNGDGPAAHTIPSKPTIPNAPVRQSTHQAVNQSVNSTVQSQGQILGQISGQAIAQTPVRPVSRAQSTAVPSSAPSMVPQGQRMGNSFIPPQPLDPSAIDPAQMKNAEIETAYTPERIAQTQNVQKAPAQQALSSSQTSSGQIPLGSTPVGQAYPQRRPVNAQVNTPINTQANIQAGAIGTSMDPVNSREDNTQGFASKMSAIGGFINRLTGFSVGDTNRSNNDISQGVSRGMSSGVSGGPIRQKTPPTGQVSPNGSMNSAPLSSSPVQGQVQSSPHAPSQGRLNIDNPAGEARRGEEESEDQLDIPAFLRRQAS